MDMLYNQTHDASDTKRYYAQNDNPTANNNLYLYDSKQTNYPLLPNIPVQHHSPEHNELALQTTTAQEDHGVGRNNTLTIIYFFWNDSFLCLSATYVKYFLHEAKHEDSTADAVPCEGAPGSGGDAMECDDVDTPYVIWNDGNGVRRLVPVTELRKGCSFLRPNSIKWCKIDKPTVFNRLFVDAFPSVEQGSYHIVGGLDSYSPGNNFLQTQLDTYRVLPSVFDITPSDMNTHRNDNGMSA